MKKSEDLSPDLIASKAWFELKTILSHTILSMREDTDDEKALKKRYLDFMAKEWPGHAPRSREIATMTSLLTSVQRERDRLVDLVKIPDVRSTEKISNNKTQGRSKITNRNDRKKRP